MVRGPRVLLALSCVSIIPCPGMGTWRIIERKDVPKLPEDGQAKRLFLDISHIATNDFAMPRELLEGAFPGLFISGIPEEAFRGVDLRLDVRRMLLLSEDGRFDKVEWGSGKAYHLHKPPPTPPPVPPKRTSVLGSKSSTPVCATSGRSRSREL